MMLRYVSGCHWKAARLWYVSTSEQVAASLQMIAKARADS